MNATIDETTANATPAKRSRRALPKKFTEPLSIQVTPAMRVELDKLAEEREITLAAAARELLDEALAARAARKVEQNRAEQANPEKGEI